MDEMHVHNIFITFEGNQCFNVILQTRSENEYLLIIE
jgi:hypothetical protein